jgi:hypothetical protein
LVQVERFARIDLNVIIRMNWAPIGTRTLAAFFERWTESVGHRISDANRNSAMNTLNVSFMCGSPFEARAAFKRVRLPSLSRYA